MKNKKCPERKYCFAYKDGYCENCVFGEEFTKLHKRIDRLKKHNEKLTINMNAYGLTAKNLGEENERLKNQEKQNELLIHTLHDKLDEGYAKFVDEEQAAVLRKMRLKLYPLYEVFCIDERDWLNEIDRAIKEIMEGE